MVTNNNEKMQELTVEEKLQNLYELQRIDTEIDKIKTLRGELPLEVQDLEDEIAGLETRIENLKVELGELDKTSSTRKMDIKKAEEAIKKYSEQLDNVRNNREYDALSKEIEFQKLEIELQEKRIREAQKAKAEKEALMEESKKRYEDKVSDLEAKKGELNDIINEMENPQSAFNTGRVTNSSDLDRQTVMRLCDAFVVAKEYSEKYHLDFPELIEFVSEKTLELIIQKKPISQHFLKDGWKA